VDTFLALRPDLISDDEKRKILWDNALDFYRFPKEMIPAELRD
jgi:predicted TIM-barrel fold metal-dependent hydrolase